MPRYWRFRRRVRNFQMTDQVDPVAVLLEHADEIATACRHAPFNFRELLTELDRRRTVEKRRDRFLFENVMHRETHECGHEQHWVVFHLYGLQPGPRVGARDYWTACAGALDDVGAPK